MDINSDDETYLRKSVFEGEAVLIIGAGASVSSLNPKGEPVKASNQLAKLLAESAGLPYNDETLTDVLGATRGVILSDAKLNNILSAEYKGVKPSNELQDLFKFTWRRIYTWNIDDSIEACNRHFTQIRRYYSGMIDKAVEFDSLSTLDIVHLHGEIRKPEHKFILSEAEYAAAIKSEKHYWYQRLAQDYLTQCPIFIGSQLAEPILSAELEKAKREGGGAAGRAFLITPDHLTPIKSASFKAKGIVHIQATLEDFSKWLAAAHPNGMAPKEIISRKNKYPNALLDSLTRDELQIAFYIKPISPIALTENLTKLTTSRASVLARHFLTGFPPNWMIAASDIPVPLEANKALYSALTESIKSEQRLFVITGQSGSGKTTAAMTCLLRYVKDNSDTRLFEIDPSVKSMAAAFKLLTRLHDGPTLVYVGDLFIYGDSFSNDVNEVADSNITVVSTARQGEWNDRLSRYINIAPFEFPRFTKHDYRPIIEKIVKYVPAPKFIKLTKDEQYKLLARSRNQLLIAMRDVTGSENFTDVITNEYETLPDQDTRALLFIIGLATVARVGINPAMAREAYSYISRTRTFHKALDSLEGIVATADDGRLYARHELYVRHIIENVATFSEFREGIRSVLRTFVKFRIPVVKSVKRQDAQLFRFILNHKFLMETASIHGLKREGSEIYQDFEVEFQLDGHFWLQYGLYLVDLGDLVEAEVMLKRSIDAYSDNPYAVHAHAALQLRIAKNAKVYDSNTRDLITSAVKALKTQDANPGLEIDEYPIVTLSTGHVGALIAHKQTKLAKEYAKQYFERLQQIEKTTLSPSITRAKERMLRFVTVGEFYDQPSHQPAKKRLRKQGARVR
ncbi:MAG TPA: SIR2 family protein [Methylophilaceae bacterium]|jgi:hypothetical protein